MRCSQGYKLRRRRSTRDGRVERRTLWLRSEGSVPPTLPGHSAEGYPTRQSALPTGQIRERTSLSPSLSRPCLMKPPFLDRQSRRCDHKGPNFKPHSTRTRIKPIQDQIRQSKTRYILRLQPSWAQRCRWQRPPHPCEHACSDVCGDDDDGRSHCCEEQQ